MTATSALWRTILLTGAGAAVETARRRIRRAAARSRRQQMFRRAGLAAAVAGVAFGTVAAIRAANH